MTREKKTRTTKPNELGRRAVERAFELMQIDDEWSVRDERGFTWWGAWLRQRIWSDQPVMDNGERISPVHARTPALRDVPDEPATYALVNELNSLASLSAFAYDPEERTISSRCGAFLYEGIAGWLERWFILAAALQASLAWASVPEAAAGRTLDDEPHPTSGPRRDPDDMLNAAGANPAGGPPIPASTLRRVAKRLAREGLLAQYNREQDAIEVLANLGNDEAALWGTATGRHAVLGWGLLTKLVVPRPLGPQRAAWIANALNLAETGPWAGEARPHPLGSWTADGGALVHLAFFPATIAGGAGPEEAITMLRSLLSWGLVRAGFAGERLAWLEAAAASLYPDDVPDASGAEGGAAAATGAGEDAEAGIPWADRTFGPSVRPARPRSESGRTGAANPPRDLLVDPADPAAFREIDDAAAVAEDGDRINVRPGTYRKPVLLDRAVAIVGDGDVRSIVLEPAGGECLAVWASGATVTGLTIRPARAGNDDAAWSAVAVHNTAVTVERCVLSSHLGATVWAGGPSSHTVLRDCEIVDGAQNAIWVTEEGRAEAVRCRVAAHRWPLTAGGPAAVLRLEDCEVVDNLDDGIAGVQGAQLTVVRSTVARNAGAGIVFIGAAPSSAVTDCTIEDNAGAGIGVLGSRAVRVQRNRIARNGGGIRIEEGASPTLQGNDLADNDTVGIGVSGDGTSPIVAENTISTRAPIGIVVRDGAGGTYEHNRLTAGEAPGVWVTDEDSRPTFRANVVTGGAAVAISVGAGGGGTFESNDLRGNAGGSWELESPGELRRTGNLEDVGRTGLRSAPGGATGSVRPN